MASERTWVDAGRGLTFLFLYALTAGALEPRFHPYLRVIAALAVSLGIVAAVDGIPRLVRGDRPILDTDSRLYSVRGLAVFILLILVTAVTVDGLRATTTLSEIIVTIVGVFVGTIVVLGSVVGYYWRGSVGQSR